MKNLEISGLIQSEKVKTICNTKTLFIKIEKPEKMAELLQPEKN